MKRKASLLILLAGAVLLQACLKNDEVDPGQKDRDNDTQIQQYITDNSLDVRSTESGLYYSIIGPAKPNDPKPDENGRNQVYVNYTGSRLDGFVFDQSKPNRPLIFALNSGQLITGFNEGIGLLHEGEKAILLLPSRLAYGNAALQNIPAYSNLRFDVELLKVRTQDEALKVFATDSLKLKIDFSKPPEGPDAEKDTALVLSPSSQEGTYYIRTKKGTGGQVGDNKQITVIYRGRFIDGTNFAVANSSDKFTYTTGGTNRIRGYLDGIGKMRLGEKGVILIPSAQGYGDTGSSLDNQGRQAIPGRTPLVFDVEITAVQ